jgi:tetratricopeptide (TPR) repeat protein
MVCRALEIDPSHVDANILAGDLWVVHWDEIGYADHSEASAAAAALPYLERALEGEPRQSDAWSGKSRCLRRLGRSDEALTAAETGLAMLAHEVGYLWHTEARRCVAEELDDGAVRALLALGCADGARRKLEEGLRLYPESCYLGDLRTELSAEYI